MSLGARIVALRKAIPASRDDLAAATGLSITSMANIERGENEPSLGNAARIAAALHVSLDELIGDFLTQILEETE